MSTLKQQCGWARWYEKARAAVKDKEKQLRRKLDWRELPLISLPSKSEREAWEHDNDE